MVWLVVNGYKDIENRSSLTRLSGRVWIHASSSQVKLPTGRCLRAMMNNMVFCIEGWDDDPREIHSIPEIRRYYLAFHKAWPYWL